MTEKRKIDDDELVEITGAGEFEAVGEGQGSRPDPGYPGDSVLPNKDDQSDGDQNIGEN